MATRTGASAMQRGAEAGLDAELSYSAAVDLTGVPNATPDSGLPEQDGLEAELYGDRTREDLGAFAKMAKEKAVLPAEPAANANAPHKANLVLSMADGDRLKLGQDLLQEIDSAELSRKEWREVMVKGVRALGFDRMRDNRNDPFPGASAVIHPAFAKALVDMAARTGAQLAPPEGPAGTKITGDATPERQEAADRVAELINWQCTEQMEEWAGETDRLLMMVSAEGSSFKKVWWDPGLHRPRVAYIPAQDVIMPYSAGCEYTSPLTAERMRPLKHEIERNIRSKLWAPHTVGEPNPMPIDEIREATDAIAGLSKAGSEDEPAYQAFEYFEAQVTRSIPGIDNGEVGEYLITVARNSNQVVAVYRNWRQADRVRRRQRIFQHYKLFSGPGAYGLGLWHMIGGLATSATGALRALLDSAMIQNMGRLYKLPGARANGGTITTSVGNVVEVPVPATTRDIREAIMADPHPGPSMVLFELLGFVTDQAGQFASIPLQDVAKSEANQPVGTTLARVDEGSRVYSSIFARLHRAQSMELQELHRIDRETLDEQREFYGAEMPEVQPGDFDPTIRIVPVSDPRTYSKLQQTMQAQAKLQLANEAKAQGINVDTRSAYVDAGRAMGINDLDVLFPPDPDPISADPFTENAALITGGKLAAQPAQPHEAHLIVHLGLLSLPGMIVTPAGQSLMQHMIQHAGMGALAMAAAGKMAQEKGQPTDGMADPGEWYVSWMQRIAPAMLPPGDPSVDKLVKVEEAKVEAGREKTLIETDAKKQIVEVETAAKKEVVAAELQADLRRIQAEDERAEAGALVNLTNSREKIASEERKKAADIAARAATPPPPKPAIMPPGKKGPPERA